MSEIIQPEPWSEFVGIWLFYISTFGLISHIAVFVLGSSLIAAFCVAKGQMPALGERMVRFAFFLLFLLIVSGGFNALWNCLVWGNLYVTSGADTEDDFTPFIPINQNAIVQEHGKLLTGTFLQLELVWLLFAAMAWGISYILYRVIDAMSRAAKRWRDTV